MKALKFYGVYASNGLMVTTNWSRVKELCRRYYRSEHYKGFQTMDEAVLYASDGYNKIHYDKPYYGSIKLHEALFTSKMFLDKSPISMVSIDMSIPE